MGTLYESRMEEIIFFIKTEVFIMQMEQCTLVMG